MSGFGIKPKQQRLYQPVQEPEHWPDRNFCNAQRQIQSVRDPRWLGSVKTAGFMGSASTPEQGQVVCDPLCMAG